MKKRFVSYIVFLVVIISFFLYVSTIYSDPFSKEEYPHSENKAKKATVKYFKKTKNINVTIDQSGIIGELGPDRMWLNGHVVENKEQKITAIVQFEETQIVKVSGELSK